jgi:hypothetical protein
MFALSIPLLVIASSQARTARSSAEKPESVPHFTPSGVRAAAAITIFKSSVDKFQVPCI